MSITRALAVLGAVALAGCGSTPTPETPAKVLRFTEYDQDGGVIRMLPEARVVDVNSRLVIDIDRVRMKAAIADWATTHLSQTELDSLIAINDLAAATLQNIPKLDAAMTAYIASDKTPADIANLDAALQPIAQAGVQISSRIKLPSFREYFNQRMEEADDPSMVTMYLWVMEGAQVAVEEALAPLERELKEQGVFIQLGGWLASKGTSRPIHLPNFDDYPEGERYEVERIAISLDDEQKKQLDAYAAVAKKANQEGLSAAIDLKKTSVDFLSSIAGIDAEDRLDAIRGKADEIVSSAGAAGQQVIDQLKALAKEVKSDIDGYVGFLRQIEAKYSNGGGAADPAALLNQVNSDIESVIRRSVALVEKMKGIKAKALQILAGTEDSADALLTEVENLVAMVQTPLETVRDQLSMFLTGKQINTKTLEFGEEVKKLDIDSVPARTEIDLISTGKRGAGDQLVFRIAAGKAEDVGTRRVLEERVLSMFQVLPHVTSAAALVLANPAGQSNVVQGDFHYAPGFSILMKFGSRDSSFYNRFIDAGFGVNVAALDFDGDDNPDLGLGGTVSLFRDWVQAGYGYDFGTDNDYWFLGISLPFTDFVGGN